ncbi:MAG: DUF2490 domain-containing protein [Bacteroidetes bacterium]|jgi:hypothetical protein|nr:DUF2490 domain-containing protein [Bacteroidota bacterium]
MRNTFYLLLLLCGSLYSKAQTRQVQYGQQSWLDYLNQNRYSNHWGSWIDLQLKLTDNYFKSELATETALGASYYTKKNLKLMGALTYVDQIHQGTNNFHLIEYRPWQMVQFNTETHHTKTLQWIRLEERYRQTAINDAPSTDYDMNFRLRYYYLSNMPLTKHHFQKGSLSFVVSEEVYFNFGKNIVYNTFDQNRFSAGFYYYINNDNIFQFGYTNVFQQLNQKNKFTNLDVIRLSIFNNIDFRKSKH